MTREIAIAFCLVFVIEGLMLFAAPKAWQRMAEQLVTMDPKQLRIGGAVAMILGLLMLQVVAR